MKRRAFVVTMVGLALLLIAATIRSGWLYLVASLMFSLVVLGFASGWLASRKLEISRECHPDAFEGDALPVRLRVENGGRLARYFLVILDNAFEGKKPRGMLAAVRRMREEHLDAMRTGHPDEGSPDARGGGLRNATIAFERIAPGESTEAHYELIAPARGVYDEAKLVFSSGGIFGMAQFTRRSAVSAPLVVYPRVSHLEYFPFRPPASAAPIEALEWARKGTGLDYYGVREYTQGDSLKHVHWRSSARQGKLIVKEYQQEFRPFAGLVVGLVEPRCGEDRDDSLEDGLRCAASILDYYAAVGVAPVTVLASGEEVRVIEEPGVFGAFDALARYAPLRLPGGAERLALALDEAQAVLPAGSALAVVTNADVDSIARHVAGRPDMEGASLVVVVDESYGRQWDTGLALLEVGQLEEAVSRRINLFVVTHGREIDRCLSEPLKTTGE